MDVPERFRRFVTQGEWDHLALECLGDSIRGDVETVLRAFCATDFYTRSDRATAFEAFVRYRVAMGGAVGHGRISHEETTRAIEAAKLVIRDMDHDAERNEEGSESPEE